MTYHRGWCNRIGDASVPDLHAWPCPCPPTRAPPCRDRSRRSPRWPAPAAVAAATSRTRPRSVKKDFIDGQARTSCQVNEEIARTVTGARRRTPYAAFEAYMETNASGQRQDASADLKALDPPDELAARTAALTRYAGIVAERHRRASSPATKIHDLKAVRKAYKDLIATSDKVQKAREFLAHKTGAQVQQT